MEYVALAVILLIVVVAVTMWVRERHWATIYEGTSEYAGPATALDRALRSEGVRSRLEIAPPKPVSAAGVALEQQPMPQPVRVRVHRDDIERAMEIRARADWRLG